MDTQEWTLRRNFSIMPHHLMLVYAALCVASLTIATNFILHGAWYVLGLAIAEISVVAVVLYVRYVPDCGHIALRSGYLLIELIRVERVSQFRLHPRHA